MAGILEDADRIAKLYAQVHLKNRENLESAINDAKSTRKRVDAVHKEGAIIALTIGIVLMLYNTRSIIGPIKGLRDGGSSPAETGHTKFDVKSGEELVELSNSIDRMRNTIIGQVDELDRPYRKGRNKGESVAELKRCAGTQFDPEVVNTFVADKEFGDML